MKQVNKRKKLLIYPEFQLKIIIVNMLITISGFSFLGFQFYRVIHNLEKMGLDVNLPANHGYFRFVKYQSGVIFASLVTSLVVGVAVNCFCTLYLSHRLAGPIVRLKGYLKGLVHHDFSTKAPAERLKFRKDDYFSDLPPFLNEAVENIERQLSKKDVA